LRGVAGDGLLDTCTQERHAHAGAMIELSVMVGKIFVPAGPLARLARNLLGPLLSRIGPVRRYIAEMRFKPMPFFADGAVVHPGAPDAAGAVGKVFVQPRVADAAGRVSTLDDALGLRFALIGWSARFDAWLGAESRRQLEALDARRVVMRPACQSLEREPPEDGLELADVDGIFRRWFDAAPGSVVVLRPDRIVAAVCLPWQLDATLHELAARLRIDLAALGAPRTRPTKETS
jgi:3-(3-hydroxy-phenyl)propionate hydroxylase